ncbi:hypothetical protein [Vibrio salilacus]|uniref:hypothetical protein n=1 Tax=Vibrio salilacus TaxID=1323749 RepID=UPI0012FD0794|nr:hypothetical protein [Vibrio salilacus]
MKKSSIYYLLILKLGIHGLDSSSKASNRDRSLKNYARLPILLAKAFGTIPKA